MAKVTTLLTDNIEVLLPDLPKMKDRLEEIAKANEEVKEKFQEGFSISCKARDDLEELKGEFEYMKTRFSPQFV